MNVTKISLKNKSILLISSMLLISPIASNIPDLPNQNSPEQIKAATSNYKLVRTKTYTKTIKQQNVEQAEVAIAGTLLSGGSALAGVGTVGKVVGALGFGANLKTLFTGGNTYPLLIKERVYEKTNRTKAEKQHYYGYVIIDVYNKNNGKKVSSRKVDIAKSGV